MSSIGKRQQKPTKRTMTTTSNVQRQPTRSGFKGNGKFRAMSDIEIKENHFSENRGKHGPVDTRERNVHRRDRLNKKEDRRQRYDERGLFMHLPKGYGKIGYGYNSGLTWLQEPEHTAKFGVTSSRTRTHYQATRQLKTKFGSGVVVNGSQMFCSATVVAASANFLNNGTAAVMPISPDTLGGRCALIARNYTKFRFTKLWFHYDAGCPTTTLNQAFMAYVHDPSIASFQTIDYTNIQSAEDSQAILPFESVTMKVNLKGKEDATYFTEIDSANQEGVRQTEQGALIGKALNINGTGSDIIWGTIQIEYEMELYDPSPDYGFTFTLPDKVIIDLLPLLSPYMTSRDVTRVKKLRGDDISRVYERLIIPDRISKELKKIVDETPLIKKADEEKSERKHSDKDKEYVSRKKEEPPVPMDVEPKGWDRVDIPDYYTTQRNEQQREFEKELAVPRLTPRVDIRDVKDTKDLMEKMKKLEVLKREGK